MTTNAQRNTAGWLDIRTIIGALLAIYGLILLLLGIFADPQSDKTGGVNANLYAGIVLLAVGGGFLLWARLKPVIVPDEVGADEG